MTGSFRSRSKSTQKSLRQSLSVRLWTQPANVSDSVIFDQVRRGHSAASSSLNGKKPHRSWLGDVRQCPARRSFVRLGEARPGDAKPREALQTKVIYENTTVFV